MQGGRRPTISPLGASHPAGERRIVAAGARHAYFGHDEWEAHAPGLKTVDDATTIRRRILLAFERAELFNMGTSDR